MTRVVLLWRSEEWGHRTRCGKVKFKHTEFEIESFLSLENKTADLLLLSSRLPLITSPQS